MPAWRANPGIFYLNCAMADIVFFHQHTVYFFNQAIVIFKAPSMPGAYMARQKYLARIYRPDMQSWTSPTPSIPRIEARTPEASMPSGTPCIKMWAALAIMPKPLQKIITAIKALATMSGKTGRLRLWPLLKTLLCMRTTGHKTYAGNCL